MPRWEADGKERLELAALELFLEVGYDRTTVAGIAKRAGLTERSFYRHFTDKREALFSSAELLTEHLVARIAAEPDGEDAYAILHAALRTGEEVFLARDQVQRRAEAIRLNPALGERELIKLAQLAEALAGALEGRHVERRQARLVVDLGLSAFRIASEEWIATGRPFAGLFDAVSREQRQVLSHAVDTDAPL